MAHPPQPLELLAPAGDLLSLRAAYENGADAVYFGVDAGFNARARATNFPVAGLPETVAELHRRGVRAYVTLNTLVFCDELPHVAAIVEAIAAAGVDAILVQDLGLARLVRAICPALPLHASTQMTLTSAETIAAAAALGLQRVVLPRELSVEEIRSIARQSPLPLEAFVHGALCVAYSGQCLTSESLGGRSANRGVCAQACRLPYDLLCDGREVEQGRQRYLLSPQDLAAYEWIPQLIEAGVTAFKIEGRLKTPEYVANITRHYRQAIDRAAAGAAQPLSAAARYDLEMSFSRGFSPGWLGGCDHKQLVPGTHSAKRGVRLGRVVRATPRGAWIELQEHVAPGDGIVFEGDRAAGREIGGRVYHVRVAGREVDAAAAGQTAELLFDSQLDLSPLRGGEAVWKTDDPQLNRRLRASFTAADPLRRVDVDLHVIARPAAPLTLIARTATGREATLHSPERLAVADRHPLTAELLREQLGRLGATLYRLRHLTADIEGEPIAPLSVLGRLRRALIAELEAPAPPPARAIDRHALESLRAARGEVAAPQMPAELFALARTQEQLRAACESGIDRVYADFQDVREYRAAVEIARAAAAPIYLATPRIQKPGEFGLFRGLAKADPNGILARNLAGLPFFAEEGRPVVADFSLNAANDLSVEYLIRGGAEAVTASYDLNRQQLLDLVNATPPAWLEVVVHQQMPLFHMEHCVFCALLSPGTNRTNCGRPCDRHSVQLRDRLGVAHRLTADVGCRNTLFNAVPQSGAEIIPDLRRRGVRRFRVEFVDQNPAEVRQVIDLYRQLLLGRISGSEVWSRLKASNRVGVTRGTLESRRNPLAIL